MIKHCHKALAGLEIDLSLLRKAERSLAGGGGSGVHLAPPTGHCWNHIAKAEREDRALPPANDPEALPHPPCRAEGDWEMPPINCPTLEPISRLCSLLKGSSHLTIIEGNSPLSLFLPREGTSGQARGTYIMELVHTDLKMRDYTSLYGLQLCSICQVTFDKCVLIH